MRRSLIRGLFGPVGLGLLAVAIGVAGFWIQITGRTGLVAPYLPDGMSPVSLATKVAGGLALLAMLVGAVRSFAPSIGVGRMIDPTDPYAHLDRPSYLADADAQPSARAVKDPEWKKRLEKKMKGKLPMPEKDARRGGGLRAVLLLAVAGVFGLAVMTAIKGGPTPDLSTLAVASAQLPAQMPAMPDLGDLRAMDLSQMSNNETVQLALDFVQRTMQDAIDGDPLARGYAAGFAMIALLTVWKTLRLIFGMGRRRPRQSIAGMGLN